METKEILIKLGLSKEECAVYLALVARGALSVSDLSIRTKLFRPAVYKAIDALKEKNLVSTTPKGKRILFSAAHPEKLSSLLSDLSQKLQEKLPELLSVYEKKEKRPTFTFLEGREGIRSVYKDIITVLKKGDTFYRYSSGSRDKPRNYYVPDNYSKIRDEKQIERFVITNELSKTTKKPKFEKSVKIVPKSFDLFEYDVTQLIYADKTAFVDYNTETAIIIENPVITEFQKKIFKLLFMKL